MNPLAKFAGVLLAFALYVNPAWGLLLTDAAAPMDLSASIEWLEDPGGTLTLQQVLSPEVAARFTPLPAGQQTLNPGYTSSVYWVRLNLGATGEAPSDWLLHVPYGQLNEVDFFVPGRRAVTSGSRRSLDSRPYFHRHFVFPVTLDSTQQTLHFRVASSNALSVPILAWPTDTFRRSDAYTQLLQFSYFGGLLLLVVYSALLFVAVRDFDSSSTHAIRGCSGLPCLPATALVDCSYGRMLRRLTRSLNPCFFASRRSSPRSSLVLFSGWANDSSFWTPCCGLAVGHW